MGRNRRAIRLLNDFFPGAGLFLGVNREMVSDRKVAGQRHPIT